MKQLREGLHEIQSNADHQPNETQFEPNKRNGNETNKSGR